MAKERSQFQKKLDAFARALFLDANGRPKSATLLYSFLLAILYIAVYAAAYLILLGPLETALSAAPVWVRNVVQYLVPALIGSALCLAPYFFLGTQKRLVPCAYLWLLALLLGAMVVMPILCDWSDGWTDYLLFLVILALPAAASIVTGGIPALLLHRKAVREQKKNEEKAKSRPSYYNT